MSAVVPYYDAAVAAYKGGRKATKYVSRAISKPRKRKAAVRKLKRSAMRMSGDMLSAAQGVAVSTLMEQSFSKRMSELRVVHTELVIPVVSNLSTGDFKIDNLRINPADVTTFPWLSHLAIVYTYYRVNSLCFKYVPAVPTTQAGNVYLAFDYDPATAEYDSQIAIAQAEGVVTSNVYMPTVCDIQLKNMLAKQFYLARSIPSAIADIRTSDCADFYIASIGNGVSGQLLGQLWVAYDVTFLKPIPALPLDLLSTRSFGHHSQYPSWDEESGIFNSYVDLSWHGPATWALTEDTNGFRCLEANQYQVWFKCDLAETVDTTAAPAPRGNIISSLVGSIGWRLSDQTGPTSGVPNVVSQVQAFVWRDFVVNEVVSFQGFNTEPADSATALYYTFSKTGPPEA